MAQRGRLVVCGDAGEALGDSIYETRIYVRGAVRGLGADCVEKELRERARRRAARAARPRGIADVDPAEFRRYGSARRLYHFHADHVGEY